MPIGTKVPLRAEDGTTMVELLVGMAMGMIVLAGLSTLLIVTMHGSARVGARVEATDNARLAMVRIVEELHSACLRPMIAPILEHSSSQKLIFEHSPYGQEASANPIPVTTTITYSPQEKTLTQSDELISGGEPESRTLVSNVSPGLEEEAVFAYYKYEGGAASSKLSAPPPNGLTKEGAETTILVDIGLTADPKSEPVADAGAAATVRNSVTFLLTPPSESVEQSRILPCR